ncbi:hypothetical protein CDAR_417131 [Caerostris darwini]|uniref:Uncharacterized protein n=1 Tax=Caerostris darwini TaxID=1538125 RepID=A0AAV4X548_9ARAC|nr:hypothetical protein CDAR_417131 [Caerostris darwini]
MSFPFLYARRKAAVMGQNEKPSLSFVKKRNQIHSLSPFSVKRIPIQSALLSPNRMRAACKTMGNQRFRPFQNISDHLKGIRAHFVHEQGIYVWPELFFGSSIIRASAFAN